MGIFDETQETSVREDDDKNRLFETHQKSGRSLWVYEKFLIPIVLVVILAIAVIFYLSLPGIGDQVRPTGDLYDAVYDHIITTEKRTVKDMTFYACRDFYWARVEVEPQELIPGKPTDPTIKYKVRGEQRPDGSWMLVVVPISSAADDVPCNWAEVF